MAAWVEVRSGGVDWRVRADCRDRLLGPDGLRLPEWLRAGSARVVKHGPHRTVYRVTLPGLAFYLKHYRLADTRAWLRQLFRPAKARMECDRALAVAGRSIATVLPLGIGECRPRAGAGESFLITRSLEGVEPLATFVEMTVPGLAPARQARLRQEVARTLGRFMAGLHRAGVSHPDLHPGNLLIRSRPDDSVELYLIDLHNVSLSRPLARSACRDNLVILNRWFILRSSRADRLRFWRAYRVEKRSMHEAVRTVSDDQALDMERRTWASNRAFWRRRDRRCIGQNRYFARARSSIAVGHTVRDLAPGLLERLLADPDEPFRRSGIRFLKDSPSSSVVEFTAETSAGARPLVYKRIRATRWSDPWTALVRWPPALRSWVFGHGLLQRRLPTARPLLVLHRTKYGLFRDGYLLTEKIDDAVELHAAVALLARGHSPTRLWRLNERVARLVRDLHRRGLSHRDLKAANLLVQEPAGRAQVWLVDLAGLSRPRRLRLARRVQNLARLNASFHQAKCLTRSDRLRFLRTYLITGLHGRGEWRAWWHAVARATEAKIERNRRACRPLA